MWEGPLLTYGPWEELAGWSKAEHGRMLGVGAGYKTNRDLGRALQLPAITSAVRAEKGRDLLPYTYEVSGA